MIEPIDLAAARKVADERWRPQLQRLCERVAELEAENASLRDGLRLCMALHATHLVFSEVSDADVQSWVDAAAKRRAALEGGGK